MDRNGGGGLACIVMIVFLIGCGPSLDSTRMLADQVQPVENSPASKSAEKPIDAEPRDVSPAAKSKSDSRSEGTSPQAHVRPQALVRRIDQLLAVGLEGRQLSAKVNAAWQILHGVVCYGDQLEIEALDGTVVNAVEHALNGGIINGFELSRGSTILPATGRYGIKARLQPGSYEGQGHVDQWIAIFAMANLPAQTPVVIDGEELTLLDWARQAQYDVPLNPLDEFSWTLIALTHYFPDQPSWQAANGMTISWEMLVEAEISQDLNSSACGGTHRLAGLVAALQAKEQAGVPDSDIWRSARSVVETALQNVYEYRNPNGTLSSNYLLRSGQTRDLAAELSSAGHLLEFVALAATDTMLSEPWVVDAARQLCDILDATSKVDLDCGAYYHALRGLQVYRDRIQSQQLANKQPATAVLSGQ